MEIEMRIKKEDEFVVEKGEAVRVEIMRVGLEYERVISEVKEEIRIKDMEVDRLVAEVSRLHEDCYRV